jgi:acyl-coenzyme A thioesterase PaaI-like protein
VNEPTVVLVAAETRFLAPVVAGERLLAEAEVVEAAGKRRRVRVVVRRDATPVFEGTFDCAVPARHVLAERA